MEAASGAVRFTMTDRQLKLFKNALQSLSKIGSDLLVEALTGRLVLRSINSSRSAYMSVTFDARFFDEYHVFDCTVVQGGLLLKHVLSTFRTQRVHKIVFEMKTTDCRATVTLHCDNGLHKSYKIPAMEAEILQATVDKEAFPTCVVAETGAMNKLLSSFSSGLEEVTIIAYGDAEGRQQAAKAVQLHSFLDPLKGHVDKSLFTQLAVDTREVFVGYTHNSEGDADVTFNLKDFKAMLGLCESLSSNVKLRFEGPGLPLVVEPHFPTVYGQGVDCEAELILATLMESHSLPRMADTAQQPAHTGAQGAWAAAWAADSWLQAGQQAVPSNRGAPSVSGLRDGAGPSMPRSTGRLEVSRGRPDLAGASPQPVPSGLLDDPFQAHSGRDGAVPQQSPSHRTRPSRLGMGPAAGLQQDTATRDGVVSRGGGAEWSEPGADDEIPGTPPDKQLEGRAGQAGVPGVIPTQLARD